MKLATALKNAALITERLKSVNGLIGTPGTQFEAVRVRRAWLFGSAAKGCAAPNDVDILLEYWACGRQYTTQKILHCGTGRRAGAMVDKEFRRRHGVSLPMDAEAYALKWLRRHMKRVSLHDYKIDGSLADGKILIYPRNDLARQGESK